MVLKRFPIRIIFFFNGHVFLILAGIGFITWLSSIFIEVKEQTTLFPSITVFGTILSLFLAFKTNEAYNRWWEARTLWGQLINSSRTWARQVLTLISLHHNQSIPNQGELSKNQKELIYRHIGYVNAMRLSLRGQNNWEEISQFIGEKEVSQISEIVNKPTHLIKKQSEHLKTIFDSGTDNDFRYMQLDQTLNIFYDVQGGCERIKNTVFPRIYSFFTWAFTWFFAFGLIFSLYDEFDWQVLIVRTLVAYVFLSLEQISRYLKDPFENRISDIPMTAMCRTIEIDLKELLQEQDIPVPVKPEMGVLY